MSDYEEKDAFARYMRRLRLVAACETYSPETKPEMFDAVLRQASDDAAISVQSFVALCVNAYAWR